jgi:hypothetical protein
VYDILFREEIGVFAVNEAVAFNGVADDAGIVDLCDWFNFMTFRLFRTEIGITFYEVAPSDFSIVFDGSFMRLLIFTPEYGLTLFEDFGFSTFDVVYWDYTLLDVV